MTRTAAGALWQTDAERKAAVQQDADDGGCTDNNAEHQELRVVGYFQPPPMRETTWLGHGAAVMFWQLFDQLTGELASFRQGPGRVGQFRDQPSQLLASFALAQWRQPTGLVPGIEPEARERRDHAQRHAVLLGPDCGEQEFVQIGP